MTYDPDVDRWVVDCKDGSEIELRCGEKLAIWIGNRFIACRLELEREWFICIDSTNFNLRKTDEYQVRV